MRWADGNSCSEIEQDRTRPTSDKGGSQEQERGQGVEREEKGATNRRASGAESSRRREAFLFVLLKGKREVLLLNIFPCHSITMHASTSVNVMSMICSRA